MSSCEDVCLRTIVFRTNGANTASEMVIKSGSVTKSISDVEARWPTRPTNDKMFGVSLPPGEYEVYFRDINTQEMIWPEYVVPVYEAAPSCSGYLEADSVDIIKPEYSLERCEGKGWLAQWLDITCLKSGAEYQITASYRIVDENGLNIDCGTSCPT
eukprot:9633856-Ditylum_brightwellii.AAC.1